MRSRLVLCWLPVGIKVGLERVPYVLIVALDFPAAFVSPFWTTKKIIFLFIYSKKKKNRKINKKKNRVTCDIEDKVRLKHERHRVVVLDRHKVGLGGGVESLQIGTMRRHGRVERGATGRKAFLLGVVRAADEAHELGHAVAMIPRRTESMLGDHPTRWEDDKVGNGNAGFKRLACEDGKDGRVLLKKKKNFIYLF